MSEKLKVLYELQKIDSGIVSARKSRASLDTGASLRQQLDIIRKTHADAEKRFHDASAEMRDCDLKLKTIESKTKAYNDKLYAGKVTNAKELSSIEQEIAMFGRQKDKLEERILELMDLIEEYKTDLASAKDTLDKHESEYNAFIAGQRKKVAILAAKTKELETMREEVLPKVDKSLLASYESLKTRLGGIGVSKVENETCSVCHTQLLKNTISALVDDIEIQTCENCSRYLYLEK